MGTAKPGHFVENVGANLGFRLLVEKAACLQFGPDDCLPVTHQSFTSTALIVAAARLQCYATTSGYGGDALVAKRSIFIRVGAQKAKSSVVG